MFVNTFHVLEQLRKSKLRNNTILCNGVNPIRVNRNRKSKWFVSWKEYPASRYDRYCTGFFLLISSELIEAMNREWPYVRFFWIDDYWMTAMLGQVINVTLEFDNNHIILNGFKIRDNYFKSLPMLYGAHADRDLSLVYSLWKSLLVNKKIDDKYNIYF